MATVKRSCRYGRTKRGTRKGLCRRDPRPYRNGGKFDYAWSTKRASGRGSNMCFRQSNATGKKKLVPVAKTN